MKTEVKADKKIEKNVYPGLYVDNDGDVWLITKNFDGMVIAGEEDMIGHYECDLIDKGYYELKPFEGSVTLTA